MKLKKNLEFRVFLLKKQLVFKLFWEKKDLEKFQLKIFSQKIAFWIIFFEYYRKKP